MARRLGGFLGIPHAAAPTGSRRFGPPEPVVPWTQERNAGTPGPTPQRRPLSPVTTIPEPSIPGEDILNLNVFTPSPGRPDSKLPVLVWIHGGGFMGGSPASPWYDGTTFSRDGVVTVVISYRLGFEGFGWIADAQLNRGLLDQLAALSWVQDNIAAFGGDPTAVTVAGQSAGGSSVLALLTVPTARDLFRSAICQSGTVRTQTADAAEHLGRRLATEVGVEPTRAGWSGVPENTILDAQSAYGMGPRPTTVDPVEFARDNLSSVGDSLAFGPVIDGALLSRPVDDALGAGAGSTKPLLIGATAHEFTLVLGGAAAAMAGVDVAATLQAAGLPRDVADGFLRAHPELERPELQLGQLKTEQLFRMPLRNWIQARAATGAGDRTWLYDFRWRPTDGALAFHCTELPFVWDLLGAAGVVRVLGEDPPQHIADFLHSAWVRFITCGDTGWVTATDSRGVVVDDTIHEDGLLGVEHRLAAAGYPLRPIDASR
jgi:para-nitrobenzyl esterase